MTFHVFEGFLSLFLCLFIKEIFISEQSDIYAQFTLVRNFQYFSLSNSSQKRILFEK